MVEVLQYRFKEADKWGSDYSEWTDLDPKIPIEFEVCADMLVVMEFRRINRGTCGTCGTGNVEFPIPN